MDITGYVTAVRYVLVQHGAGSLWISLALKP
jgi:hypothetical protein